MHINSPHLIKINGNISQGRIPYRNIERENNTENNNRSTIRSLKLFWFYCPMISYDTKK